MTQTATLANGCFWCTEAVFQRLRGIHSVQSGYTGGNTKNPDYDHVSMGTTGHAEAVQITYDSEVISYSEILDVFFATHDPTTVNAQGNDIGTQYRSAIFYHDERQQNEAKEKINELNESGIYAHPIVTEIVPAVEFYPAEKYHTNYYTRNRESNPYCTVIIDPKVKKLLTKFADKVKEEYQEVTVQ